VAYSPPPDDNDAGYALPASLLITLALAVVGVAVLGRTVSELRASRGDYERLRIEAVLAGIQVRAANAVVSSRRPAPYDWPIATELGTARVVAEPEAAKLSLAAAAALSDEALQRFGVLDASALRARLQSASRQTPQIGDLDAARLWRRCAPLAISAYGQAETFVPARHEPQSWRVGEVWSVTVATPNGWRDNRLVRFTGDVLNPAATIARRFVRIDQGERSECEEVLNGLATG
jgi:hypothetical protein